ncbi:MAG: transposase [Kiritimatiellia bacterium]
MRVARLKESGKRACYHIMSRVVDRQMVLGSQEKEKFRKLMRQVEGFSGVRVLTYAILDNHFHILLEVPEPKQLSDKELLQRLQFLYPPDQVSRIAEWIKAARDAGEAENAEAIRNRYICRMYDLSEFVKTLKQRYTQWHNKRHNRKGTLWEERFKSVLLEATRARKGQSDNALLTIAAYIDLNALRAGIVRDPRDYRYCGYGEACGGGKEARACIARIFANYGTKESNWNTIGSLYRQQLYCRGEQRERKAGFSREQVQAVLAGEGKLSLADALQCRVRYFSDGVALGSKAFVEDVFVRNRAQFGVKRKTGARPLRKTETGDLCTMRDLRRDVIHLPQAA